MKKVLLIALGLFLCTNLTAKAYISEPMRKRCTCYLDEGETASGHYTREGIVAGRREDLGRVAAIYRCDTGDQMGEFIGYYEFLDTGAGIDTDGDGKGDSIKKGLSIDVFKPSMEEAKAWISEYGDYVYVQYIDAEG